MTSYIQCNSISSSSGTTYITNGYPYRPGQIIEYLSGPCDGGNLVGLSGTYTTANVTSAQIITSSYVDVTGSSITYTPPTGTSRVIYKYNFGTYWIDSAHSIQHFKFFIDGVEVTYARHNRSMQYLEYYSTFEWIIPIGGLDNSSTGRQSTWTTGKVLKLQTRKYANGANGQNLNGTTYWDGGGSNQFNRPSITIISIA